MFAVLFKKSFLEFYSMIPFRFSGTFCFSSFARTPITARVITSEHKKDSQTPFSPKILDNTMAQMVIATAPLRTEPTIAGLA